MAASGSRMPTRALILLLVLLFTVQLFGCAALGTRSPGEPSTAHADTQDTRLARIAAASLSDAPSGFRLLPRGDFAFDARLALARLAERSIDAQYYHLQPDGTRRALLHALRDAAARGVRVRLLVDDFHAAPIDDLLLDLSAHDNVQVRLFNPLALRKGAPTVRLLLSPCDLELHNHRMHNKLWVADNALAVFGGRNLGDEYFMSHPVANFVDLDVLAAGAVVRQLSAAFDDYWNSELAWPVQDVLGASAAAGVARARFAAAVGDAAPAPPSDTEDPLGQSTVTAQLATGRLVLIAGSAEVHADVPKKGSRPRPNHGPARRRDAGGARRDGQRAA